MAHPRSIDPEVRNWQAFLNREISPESPAPHEKHNACVAGKRVLVTGAGGYIGSALAKHIARLEARELILLDASEGALYDIDQTIAEVEDAAPHVSLLASVCDQPAIASVFSQHRPEIVFHAAAFKHVPLMEANPFAVVANNVIGTQVLTETAAAYRCEQMLMVSTDKAVDPFSIMGASKRIAELIMLSPRTDALSMKIVRLGNVLGSSGSVVPLFLRQIAQGGPVTVSHPEVRRYFMTLTEAVESLLCAAASDIPSGLVVPQLGDPIRIFDLAKYLIGDENSVPIIFTELRPGDKMHESLISEREFYQDIPGSKHLRGVRSPTLSPDRLSTALDNLRTALQQRHLPALVDAVLNMVPEYQPGSQLRESLHAPATVNA